MQSHANSPHVSLKKSEVQDGMGAELLAFCQSLTKDGSISDAQAHELKRWLEEHSSADLPALEFLKSVVNQLVTEEVTTPDRRKLIYKTIESVLPADARKVAAAHRKAAELVEREQAHAAHEAEKQHVREERERNRPVATANFMVAGVNYEGRAAIVRQYVKEGDQVFLIRDRQNKFSRNAVEVRLSNGYQIGFVPEGDSEEFAPFLDKGCVHLAYVTKILHGHNTPIPVVQADVFRPDSEVEGVVSEQAVPSKKQVVKSGGCLVLLAILGITILIGIVFALSWH
jgi:HIRAN domain